METIVFEVRGEYALFKKPYSSMSPVSYPFPPPTAVMGMLGAIAGYPKAIYAGELGWLELRIAVRILQQPRPYQTALNLLNTKDGTDSWFRPKADQNTHIQVPCEFLQGVAYRLYVSGLPEQARDKLVAQLEQGTTVFTPSLGWASCLAELDWIGIRRAVPVDSPDWACHSVLPLTPDIQVNYQDQRRYHRLRVPVTMDDVRIVHRFQEVVSVDDGEPVKGRGNSTNLFEIGDETIAFL